MRKIFFSLCLILSISTLIVMFPKQISAQQISCSLNPSLNINTNTKLVNLTFTSNDIAEGSEIKAKKVGRRFLHTPGNFGAAGEQDISSKFTNGKVIFENIDGQSTQRNDGGQVKWEEEGEFKYQLYNKNGNLLCDADGSITVTKVQNEGGDDICLIDWSLNKNKQPTPEDNIIVKVAFYGPNKDLAPDFQRGLLLYRDGSLINTWGMKNSELLNGYTLPIKLDSGTYQVGICQTANCNSTICTNGGSLKIDSKLDGGGSFSCKDDTACAKNANGENFCVPNDKTGILTCRKYPNNGITNPCQPTDRNGKLQAIPKSCKTAIGNIGIQPENFAKSVLTLILSLSGGILVLFFIINGFKLMTSQGDPKKIQEARESLTSAIAGLLVIIFSLAILRLITVDILGIPGFS